MICYQFSGEVSGNISDDISGDVSGFATIPVFFCYNSTTFLLHHLRRGLRRDLCVALVNLFCYNWIDFDTNEPFFATLVHYGSKSGTGEYFDTCRDLDS